LAAIRDHVGGHHGACDGVGVPGILGALARHSQQPCSAGAGTPWLAVGGYVIALVAAMLFTLSYVRAGALTRMLAATVSPLVEPVPGLATLGPWLALCAVTAFGGRASAGDLPVQHTRGFSMAVVLAGLVFSGTGIDRFESAHGPFS
jgi:hypothetical protein